MGFEISPAGRSAVASVNIFAFAETSVRRIGAYAFRVLSSHELPLRQQTTMWSVSKMCVEPVEDLLPNTGLSIDVVSTVLYLNQHHLFI